MFRNIRGWVLGRMGDEKEAAMGYDIKEKEVSMFLKDKRLVSEIVKKITSNEETLNELANDIVDDLADAIKQDPTIKKQIVAAAMKDASFKQKVVQQLVEELAGD